MIGQWAIEVARHITLLREAAHLLRVPILVSSLLSVALLIPQQTREVYVAYAEGASEFWLQIILGGLLLSTVCGSIWLMATELLASESWQAVGDAPSACLWNPITQLAPTFLSLAPLAALASALAIAGYSANQSVLLIPVIGISVLTSAVLLRISIHWHETVGRRSARYPRTALVLIGAAFVIIFEHIPTDTPRWVGPIALIAAFALSLGALLHLLCVWLDKYEWPALRTALTIALILSAFGCTENHRLVRLPEGLSDFDRPSLLDYFMRVAGPTPLRHQVVHPPTPSLDDAFTAWLSRRPDVNNNRDIPYPIYVIAAQGGGIYAAQHAAVLLSRLQDACPAFARHIFAISSVSGGSVGAATFSTIVTAEARRRKAMQLAEPHGCKSGSGRTPASAENAARAILGYDFLSPLLSAGLFPDFVQRFFPHPVGHWDRSRGLDKGIADAWTQGAPQELRLGDNPMTASYRGAWDSGGEAPALILNTTLVETGERLPFAPFTINGAPFRVVADLAPDLDVAMATAVGASARFPLVTSAGEIDVTAGAGQGMRLKLVDGGYFENSGIATALDIIQRIRPLLAKEAEKTHRKFRLALIALTGTMSPQPDVVRLVELDPPLRALLNTRGARSVLEARRAQELLGGRESEGVETVARIVEFDAADHDLPLGWFLSEKARDKIGTIIGWPSDCYFDAALSIPNVTSSACVMRIVEDELSRLR